MVPKEVRYLEYHQMHLLLIIWNSFARVHSIGIMIIKITSKNASWNCIMIISHSINLRRQRKKYHLCLWRTRLLRLLMKRNACFLLEINSVIISSKLAQRKICLAGKFIDYKGYMQSQKPLKFVIPKYIWTKWSKNWTNR